MKKLIICLFLSVAIGATAATPPEVTEKVLKAFNETFAKATDVVWHEMQNSYEASFKHSAIVTRASYDKEGNLLRTTRYYQEENLPINILSQLKKRYDGKTVFGVTESATEEEVSYYITLEDAKNWYIVKADSWGSFELHKKYKKA
jgi:hypothetical protein